MIRNPVFWMILGFSLIVCGCDIGKDKRTPLEIARSVADKVINESDFSFGLVPQETVLGMQVIDFLQNYSYKEDHAAFAHTYLISPADTTVLFGLSSSGPTQIRLNGDLVTSHPGKIPSQPVEESYNRFAFQKVVPLNLKKGSNDLMIRLAAGEKEWVFYIRPLSPEGDHEQSIEFSLQPLGIEAPGAPWLCTGPFKADKSLLPPDKGFQDQYQSQDTIYHWIFPKQGTLRQLKIDDSNSYRRDSYLDWHYANGATMWAILALGNHSQDEKYSQFVVKYCDFTLAQKYYFQWQYNYLHAFRGSFHRLFRRTMLDDTGAPALPFIELYLQNKQESYRDLILSIARYIQHEQVRLPDGTLCRPEPVRWTLWADDLFMSIPFLLRMAKISGDQVYYDETADQIQKFYRLLYDTESGLSYHGWFSPYSNTSPVFWGRANGWMIWALSEALQFIPDTHDDYQQLLAQFRAHIGGLIRYQDAGGLWHQVLDKPESFLETSCTAMYTLALARGVLNGWLPDSYRLNALKAWNGLKTKIDRDGTVRDICRGTGIGDSFDFYFARQRFDHDPRGLGAVITASLEMDKLMRRN